MLNSRLQWEEHVSLVVQRCYSKLAVLAKFSHRLPSSLKQLIIEALVFLNIVYCLTVWGGCHQSLRHRVQKLLNHGAQLVFGASRRTHVTPLLAQLNWQSLDSLISERDILTIHRLLYAPQAPCEPAPHADVP